MIYRVVSKERMYQAEELWDYCFEKRQSLSFSTILSSTAARTIWL